MCYNPFLPSQQAPASWEHWENSQSGEKLATAGLVGGGPSDRKQAYGRAILK